MSVRSFIEKGGIHFLGWVILLMEQALISNVDTEVSEFCIVNLSAFYELVRHARGSCTYDVLGGKDFMLRSDPYTGIFCEKINAFC